MMHSFIIMELVGFAYIIYRYKTASKNNLNFWGNPNFYLFVLSIFYLIQPCYLYYEEIFQLIIFKDHIIEKVYRWSVYYFSVFFLFYIFSSDRKFKYHNPKIKISVGVLSYIRIILFISCFVLSLIVLFTTKGIDAYSSRIDKYVFYVETQKTGGFMLLSWFVVTWSFISSIIKKNIYYMLLLMPLLYLELVCSSRFYIFVFIVMAFLYRLIVLKLNIKISHLIIPATILFMISLLRDVSFINLNILSLYVNSIGEFVNTWNSIGLVLSDNFKFDTSPLFVFTQRLIPEPFSGFVFGPKLNYANYIQDMHNFQFGLGSSIVTEGIAYGDTVAYLLPLVLCLIYLSLGVYVNKNTISAKVVNLFLIINTFSVFRGAAIINMASYTMIYLFLFLIPYYLLKEFRLQKPNLSLMPSQKSVAAFEPKI